MSKSNFAIPKIISPIYTHPIWTFIALLVIVLMIFITQYFQSELYMDFVPTVSAFSILSLITPWVANYLYKTFLSLQDTISSLTEVNQQEWFSRQKFLVFGINFWSVAVAIILAIGGEITNYYLVSGIWTGIAKIIYFLHTGLLFGILGMLGWTYCGILLFAYRLRNLKLDPEPFETKREEFDKLNSSFLGMFIAGVILYIGALISGWVSPLGSYMLEIPMLQYWIFPLAIVVIGFFILIQFFLHEVMKKAKKSRVNKITLLIRKHYREWEQSQSSSKSGAAINDLLLWKEKIEKEIDFPFDFLTTASIIITILLPTIKTILELL